MPLSEKQLELLYQKTERLCEKIANASTEITEASTNISWIRGDLEKGAEKFGEHEKRINKLEDDQALLKGKLGAFVIFLTLCGTILIQGIGWVLTHLFSHKGVP